MSKIKHIHCIGTSFTAGGGFEWDSVNEDRRNILEKCYGTLGEKKTQYNFSWPGQLQKIFNEKKYKINVYNQAKSGYGLDRVFRIIYDIVNEKLFNKHENLFLLEFSDFGRLEYYFEKINDYIVTNYQTSTNKKEIIDVGLANNWFYDNDNLLENLNSIKPKILDFLKLTYNKNVEFKRLSRQTSFFLSWIKYNNINVIFSSPPLVYSLNDFDFLQKFNMFCYDKRKKEKLDYITIHDFIIKNNLDITNETNYTFQDFHSGFHGNKIIAKIAFNHLIQFGYIDDLQFDIDKEIENYYIYKDNHKKVI
jgi:hypothetical protein